MPWIPVWLRPKILPQGLVIKVDGSSRVNIHDIGFNVAPPPGNESHPDQYKSSWTLDCVQVSPSGEILTSLWDVEGDVVSGVSSVEEHEGRLWLGNLKGSGVGVYNVQPED